MVAVWRDARVSWCGSFGWPLSSYSSAREGLFYRPEVWMAEEKRSPLEENDENSRGLSAAHPKGAKDGSRG